MKIPTPQEIGLSDKFEKWRPNQEAMIDLMVNDTKRGTEICAPTGSGKSPAYMAAAILSRKPTCIVTQNRGLQDQLMEDFACNGLVDLRGASNYQCEMREDYTCEEGHAARCPYKGSVGCPRSAAEFAAATSPLVVTNYDKWIASKRYGTGMSHFEQVIFDEGHHAPDALSKAMQVVLHHREIEETLGIPFVPHHEAEDLAKWKEWAKETRVVAENEMHAARERMSGVSDPKPSWIRHFMHMKHLTRRLAIIATARPSDWVVDEIQGGYQFDPIRPGRYAESTLLLRIPRVFVISATIRPKTMFMIGMGKDSFSFKEFDSDFNPQQCPIYYIPTMRVDSKTDDYRMLWLRHDQIAGMRQDRKGIVHTISYARRDDIMACSRFAPQMLINEKGIPPTKMIEEFRLAGPGTELVSPTVGTGYDFPGKDCEWQFVCKVPFLPPSKVKAARQAADHEYEPYIVMQSLVQMFGRGARSKKDWCENFIGDDHFKWFYSKFSHLAPKSFHGFYKELRSLPAPPRAM